MRIAKIEDLHCAQRRTNDVLVASDRRFHLAATTVTGRFLPGHAPVLRNELDMTVPNGLAVSFGRND